MYLTMFFLSTALQGIYVRGIDLNSIFGRLVPFSGEQANCNQRFIDVYPHLSKSVTGLTEAETFMLLYTSEYSDPEILDKCAGRLPPDSKFDPGKQTVIIFMPFIASTGNVAAYREWAVEFLKKGIYNVIVIDYSWGNQADYATSVLNAQRIVRYQVLILLENIQKQIGVPFVHLTFVGHSLGAQLSGMVGASFPVYRIIGLDPAGPGFAKDETPLVDRLDPSDAKLVEVWLCNAGPCLPSLGIDYDAGHLNFYINGGSVQPQCYPYAFESLLKLDFLYGIGTLLQPTTCFHAQCAVYFRIAINPEDCQFVGVRCDSKLDYMLGKCRHCGANGENCLIMGWDTDKYINEVPTTPQKYFVETSLLCPYCDNKHVMLDGYEGIYLSSVQSRKDKKGFFGIL